MKRYSLEVHNVHPEGLYPTRVKHVWVHAKNEDDAAHVFMTSNEKSIKQLRDKGYVLMRAAPVR